MYFDPAFMTTYFSKYRDKTVFSKWPDVIDGLPNGLEKADYIFITHHHKDHCKKVTIDRLSKEGTKIFAPASCIPELGNRFTIVKPADSFVLERGITLAVVNAYNTKEGSSTRKQHKRGMGVGYILSIQDFSIYHLGDTDRIPEMDSIQNIDLALVPIGGKFTMNSSEAVETMFKINPKVVIPVHNLGVDPTSFFEKVAAKKIKCIIPTMGKAIEL
jgi:L-ascorbate metabolism protein UlaG (beta-lactamase superfamily)